MKLKEEYERETNKDPYILHEYVDWLENKINNLKKEIEELEYVIKDFN